MRILMIAPFYYPNVIGGEERVVQLLSEGLYRKGNKVGIYTLDSKKKNLEIMIQNGVKIFRGTGGYFSSENISRTEKKSIRHRINSIIQIYNPSIKRELYKVIDDFKPDIVHTHNLYGFSTTVWKYVKIKGIPIIHTAHDYWLLNRSKLYLTRKNSSYVNFFVAPSKFVIEKFNEKSVFEDVQNMCIPNGIDINKDDMMLINREAIMHLQTNNVIRFIYAGQLEKIKGIVYLINAFKMLTVQNVELVICGDGTLRNYVISIAKNDSRIKYLGKLSFDELEKEYKKSTVLVAPSVWDEPFGMVAIEAYIYSLPIIAGNRGGLAEIVNQLKNGELIEPTDIKQLSECMNKFCNKHILEKYCYRKEKNNFLYNIETQIKLYEKCYKTL